MRHRAPLCPYDTEAPGRTPRRGLRRAQLHSSGRRVLESQRTPILGSRRGWPTIPLAYTAATLHRHKPQADQRRPAQRRRDPRQRATRPQRIPAPLAVITIHAPRIGVHEQALAGDT
jgi:hypothetical protein